MITLPPFRLHRPGSIDEAVGILAEHAPDARVLAGGTDLIVNLRNRLFTPSHVVSIGGIRALAGVTPELDGGLRVGSLARVGARPPAAAVLGSSGRKTSRTCSSVASVSRMGSADWP